MEKCLILMLLDDSSSMIRMKSETIEGFNNFIDSNQELKDQAKFYFIKFNHNITVVNKFEDFDKIMYLEDHSYKPSGFTALYDAVAKGIEIVEKDLTEKDSAIVVIITDGEDNSSKQTTANELKELIESKKKTGCWNFVYIGANPLEWSQNTGTPIERCSQFESPKESFAKASSAISEIRMPVTDKSNLNLIE